MTPEQLAALIRRPAVREFADQDVCPEVVRSIVDIARWTGSARNRQPWRFVDVRDRDTIHALSRLGAYAQFVADSPAVLVVAAQDNGFTDTDYDTGRVTQSLILAAAAYGIDSCLATVHAAENVSAAARLLGLEPAWQPRHLLALGHAARTAPRQGTSAIPRGRLTAQELLRFG